MKVCFVMPCWNQVRCTREAVGSLRTALRPEDKAQFVFVDNGSTDETNSYFRSLSPWPEAVVVENRENKGVTVAWNQGLAEALETDCDFICLTNNDIIFGKGFLDEIEAGFARFPKSVFVPCTVGSPEDLKRADLRESGKGIYVPCRDAWCMFFRREDVPIFHPIPEEMKIWYNANWMFDLLAEQGITPKCAKGSLIFHYGSVSFYAYPGYVEQVAKDKAEYERLLTERWKSKCGA